MADFDDALTCVAKALADNSHIEALGKKLGFTPADISRYLATNTRHHDVTWQGTLKMLRDWNEKTSPAQARRLLREALLAANLVRIADTCLPVPEQEASQEPPAPPAPSNIPNSQGPGPYVTEKQLNLLAGKVLASSYSDLGTALGFSFAEYTNIQRKHLMDGKEASLELLNKWKMRTGGLQSDLDAALIEAQCGGLVKEYKSV